MWPSPPLWIWCTEILFQNFQIFHDILLNLANFRERPMTKACRSRKKESKQSEITQKQSEPVRSISKIEKRREFVRALWYEHCPKNSFKRLYTLLGGCWFWSKKLHFQTNFGRNFIAVEGGTKIDLKIQFLKLSRMWMSTSAPEPEPDDEEPVDSMLDSQ